MALFLMLAFQKILFDNNNMIRIDIFDIDIYYIIWNDIDITS